MLLMSSWRSGTGGATAPHTRIAQAVMKGKDVKVIRI